MSQIASFYLLKDGRRQELSNGDCSGAVYVAVWDWCESELDLDVRVPAPQTEDTLDCALLEGELATELLAALREQDLPELSDVYKRQPIASATGSASGERSTIWEASS